MVDLVFSKKRYTIGAVWTILAGLPPLLSLLFPFQP